MSDDGRIHHRVKVLDNGCQEIVLADVSGEEVHFPFDRQKGFYICELSCRLVNHHLTNVVRKLFMTFKGDGVVHRIYEEFTMTYVYAQGSVRKIVEQNGENTRLIYEYKTHCLNYSVSSRRGMLSVKLTDYMLRWTHFSILGFIHPYLKSFIRLMQHLLDIKTAL